MMQIQDQKTRLLRLETYSGELVAQQEIPAEKAPYTVILGQRVFQVFFPGEAVTVYRELEHTYVLK